MSIEIDIPAGLCTDDTGGMSSPVPVLDIFSPLIAGRTSHFPPPLTATNISDTHVDERTWTSGCKVVFVSSRNYAFIYAHEEHVLPYLKTGGRF
jgi:hypothetical protein